MGGAFAVSVDVAAAVRDRAGAVFTALAALFLGYAVRNYPCSVIANRWFYSLECWFYEVEFNPHFNAVGRDVRNGGWAG